MFLIIWNSLLMEVKQPAKDKLHFEDLMFCITFSVPLNNINGKCKDFRRFGIENMVGCFRMTLIMNTHAIFAFDVHKFQCTIVQISQFLFRVYTIRPQRFLWNIDIAFGGRLYFFVSLNYILDLIISANSKVEVARLSFSVSHFISWLNNTGSYIQCKYFVHFTFNPITITPQILLTQFFMHHT